MKMNMVNIAVAGAGYWGRNLIRNFNELGVLHTICDSNPAILDTFQEKYPRKEFQDSFQLVLQNKDVNAVVIATPAETHFQMGRNALLSDKHVFVEKPLAMNVDEAEELHHLAVSRGLILMVGHILLYHPAIIRLKEIVNSGELGKINYVYSNRLNLGKIRSEENILWSFAPHDISAILYLLEEMPSEVIALGGNYLNHDIADVTISILSFKSGVKGHIFVSWLHPNKEQKLIIVGDKKMAVFDDTLIEGKLQIHDKGVEWIKRQPVLRKNGTTIIPIESYEPLKAECQHFLKCIQTGAVPESDGINGIKVLNVLNACQKSLENRGAIMSLEPQKLLILQNSEKIQRKRNGYNNPQFSSEQDSDILLPHNYGISRVGCSKNENVSFFVHETAIVDSTCKIGKGTEIWHFSHIMPGVQIGDECNIGQNVIIASDVIIGNNVKIKNNVSVYSGVIVEDDVSCGSSVVLANAADTRGHINGKCEIKSTLIKKGATIDANATIVCGSIIGSHAFVEAGAVVTKDIPNHSLVLGNPARVVGWVCECHNHLFFNNDIATCGNCKKQYKRHEGSIRCIGCECGSPLNFQDGVTTCSDCNKQLYNCKCDNKYQEKDLNLPRAAEFVQNLK